jgi:hypothetical protein
MEKFFNGMWDTDLVEAYNTATVPNQNTGQKRF